jgi:hypothetical protein
MIHVGYIGIHSRIRTYLEPYNVLAAALGCALGRLLGLGRCLAMTKEKMQELEGAGEDPFLHKEDMGGLIGALLSMMASIHSPTPPRYLSRMYPACIPHVSRIYPACILHVS